MKGRKFWWITGFVLLLVSFVGLPVALVLTQPPSTNEENCRLDGTLPAHTVVLIDQSDPFTESDVEWAKQLIYEEAQALKKTGRLTVLAINESDEDNGITVFSRCSPGSPSAANPFFENKRFITQDWNVKFEKDMSANIEEVMLRKQSESSPLVEHIKGILRRVDFRESVSARRILIISDLYQNSSSYSMYSDGLDQDRFGSAIQGVEMPSLKGVNIALFRADRNTTIRGEELVRFWETNLSNMGADEIETLRD